MKRWMLVAVVSLTCLSPAMASLDRKQPPGGRGSLAAKVAQLPPASADDDEYRVTEQTEVMLDGRPCRYELVPDGATILLMEIVSNENHEVLKLHFASPRRPAPVTAESR